MPQQQMTEEQLQELQEKIKNMSPEELKEFQKKQCIFCHIVAGKVQSKVIYQDDKCIAILDINPANPGHVLLFPKEHYSIMPQVPEEEISHLFMIAKTLSNSILRSLGVGGTNIIVQNGIAAGQKAQHFMIHIIPRKEKDGLKFEIPQREIPENELEAIRKKLETKLGAVEETKQKPKIQELIKPKVVEAEFKEEKPVEKSIPKKAPKPKTSLKKNIPKKTLKPKKPEKKISKKTPKPKKPVKKQPKKEIGLDDIARVIGAK
jgi:histidine triad (HIT) family protein